MKLTKLCRQLRRLKASRISLIFLCFVRALSFLEFAAQASCYLGTSVRPRASGGYVSDPLSGLSVAASADPRLTGSRWHRAARSVSRSPVGGQP